MGELPLPDFSIWINLFDHVSTIIVFILPDASIWINLFDHVSMVIVFTLIDSSIWILSFLVGLFSGALFYSFYNSGIAKIDSNTAALMTGVIPISSAILAIIFLNEPFHVTTFLGMLCVLISIYVGVRYSEQSKVLLHRVRK